MVGMIFRPMHVAALWPLLLSNMVSIVFCILVAYIYMRMFMAGYKYKYTMMAMMISTNSVSVPLLIL
jgi:hypothetical protein